MSGLLDSLSAASRSLGAAQAGIEVAGQNLANINTPGYSRRRALFAEEPPTSFGGAGRGVTLMGIQAERDQLVENRLRHEKQAGAFDSAMLDGMTEVEGAVGLPGQSLDAQLTAFFDAFKTLADTPSSPSARDNVAVQARQLTLAFHDLANRFTTAQRNADLAVVSATEEVNRLAADVAQLNEQISAGGSDVESLKDRRNVDLGRLSELAAVQVTTRSDGSVDVAIGQGRPLVVGATANAITTSTSGPSGFNSLSIGGFNISTEVTSGRIGGLINLRDTMVPAYQGRLDEIAYDVASAVNTAHQSGFDANGTAGAAFFTPLSGASGAAQSIAVSSAILSDPQLVAASGTGAIGDNSVARAIASLRDSNIVAGNTATPLEAWGQLAYRVGSDLESARASNTAHADVVAQVERLRDQVSGVSMDEEAANLIRFQRAYQANARYFTTIVDTLDTLFGMVR